jgi:hypothetical protein
MEMRRLIVLLIVFRSAISFAHEVQVITQHIKLNRQNDSAWQSDVLAKAVLSPKWEAGLQGTYLERFDLYERRAGAFVVFTPIENLTFEARYLKGDSRVQILPQDQYSLSIYHALAEGISPFILYQNSLYTITHLQSLRLGVEIEKIPSLIIIPQVMLGQAQFKDPAEVREVNSFGLKLIYYKEQHYSVSLYGFRGIEASQSIIGNSSSTVATKTVGFGGGYYFFPNIKTEFIFDYTDLGTLDNQFLTSTLNLVWTF